MLSLVKIRIKYIIRNPCLLFWTYILIPGIIIVASIFVILNKKSYQLQTYKIEDYIEKPNKNFFNDNYETLKNGNYMAFTAFLVDNLEMCDKIYQVLQENGIIEDNFDFEENIICNNYESNFSGITMNIIKIKKNKDKYIINLKSKTGNETEYSELINIFGFDMEKFIMYNKDDLNYDLITDPFYVFKRNETSNLIKFNIFFELQSLIAKILLKLENNKPIKDNFEMSLGFNKYPDSYQFANAGEITLTSLYSFLITLQFALVTYNVNMRMIDEKEHKLNSLLERQGISKFKYNISWLFTFLAVSLFSIIGFILLIYGSTISHIYLSIINLILYILSLFSVCVFFTVCIKTTKTGATAIKFYNFGSLFLGFVLVLPSTLKATKVVFSFIPHINFYSNFWITYCLSNFEKLNFDLLLLRASKTGYFESMMMYLVNIVFYLGIAIFIQSYKDSGLNFFAYLKSFCTKVSRNTDINNNINENEEKEKNNILFEKHFQELSEINQQKSEQNKSLKLINVSKYFDDLKAVNCFNGELFSNEIFCLLGHNGAGKTTTINMISGIYDPDEGDILLNGKSLVTNKQYLYENIGLCQQEDIFFDYLTVEEHLEYMCKIKGSKVNHQEIDELIVKIDLSQKKNALCKTLSGGQKRKLCIALALIGDSKIILLDEPTSGMDVMARRSLWEFLKNYKKDKILLLTTHFLDEAEYLGDRIGIMSDGNYLCCGSSTYLKSKYPCGFNINLIINSEIFNEDYKNQIFNEILKLEPNAEIKIASKGIFSLNIPSDNKKIKEIFEYIEKSKDSMGIEDYTVASTSLEDVFLKINNKGNLGEQKYLDKKDNNDELVKENIVPKTSGFCTQLCAQIKRGFYPFYRNKTLFFFELLSGLGFVYIYIFFFADSMKDSVIKKLSLTEILSVNKIYVNENMLDFLKSSDTYDSYGTYITIDKLKGQVNNINEFIDLTYDQAFCNIAKGALYIKEENVDNKNNYIVYNTEVDTNLFGYLYANTMLFVSAFLKKNYQIKATIFPEIEFNSLSSGFDDQVSTMLDSIALIIVCLINFFGFVIFLGGLMLEKIKEKRTNIKHLLYLSGSNIFSYWLGFYIVDYIKLLIFSILLIAPIFTLNNVGVYFGLDMLIINISTLSFIYFISFFCSKDDDGAKVLFLFIFSFIVLIVLLFIVFQKEATKYILNFTDAYKPTFFDMTPVTSMILSFIRIILSYSIFSQLDAVMGDFKLDTIGGFQRPEVYLYTSYVSQIVNIVFYTLLLILAESGLLSKLSHCFTQICYADSDIKKVPYVPPRDNNRNIINNNNIINMNNNALSINKSSNDIPLKDDYNNNIISSNDQLSQINKINPTYIEPNLDFNLNNQRNLSGNPLQNPYVEEEIRKVHGDKELTTRIINVTKTFYPCCGCCRKGKVRAINHLHLGLEPNEKFGLLGFNGSGKTTTFRAITNEIMVDWGSINLFGYDTKSHFNNIRTIVGYCPQINPLFDFMKVKEIITFYSKLKTCYESVESICEKFGLSKYMDTYTINLSGGNKRKLTFAIAMMNKPSLLLLDEPSTGVDPESRRIMWRNINELSNSGHRYNMILTTHSMEEAEILCDTVSWFKAGNFITLGNPEKLKIKYSAGYKLHIKFDTNNLSEKKQNDINNTFNKICNLVLGFNTIQNYVLSNPMLEPYINKLINVVEKIKDKVKNISLSQIGKDYSFELVLQIIEERKKDLFVNVLSMKNEDNSISELTISMQSLENILTSL